MIIFSTTVHPSSPLAVLTGTDCYGSIDIQLHTVIIVIDLNQADVIASNRVCTCTHIGSTLYRFTYRYRSMVIRRRVMLKWHMVCGTLAYLTSGF